MRNSFVILSGGQDSTTCLYWAKQYFNEIHAISFDYGQKHAIELESAKIIAEMSGVNSHQIINIKNLLRGRSPLISNSSELEQYKDFQNMEKIIGKRVELTFVPMRNSLFLTIAANYALEKNIYDLITGVCEQDNANYPDCRKSFITRQEQVINEALGIQNFKIHAPLINLTKAQSIALAKDLPGCMEALAYSHTSYHGEYPPIKQDHATVLRAQGFLEANTADPLIVRAFNEGLINLPLTSNYDIFRNK